MTEKYYKDLYKKGSSGKIKYWNIRVSQDQETGCFIETTQSGYVSGKMKTSEKQSTPNAVSIARTKVDKKIREGYVESLEAAQKAGVTLSGMQAKFFTIEEAQDLFGRFPMAVDEKFNGLRGTYHRCSDSILSKGNKTYDVKHIQDQMRSFCDSNGLKFVDFELYIPGLKVNEISSAVKNKSNPNHEKLLAYVFDALESEDDKRPFRERKKKLQEAILDGPSSIYSVPTTFPRSSMDLGLLYNSVIGLGGEGIIIRDSSAAYEWDNKSRRSTKMIKVKPLKAKEYRVIGCSFEKRKVEGEWKDLIIWTAVTENGETFSVTPEGSVESRCQPAPESYDDLWLIVEYRELTSKGIPFHGVGKGFRIPEDMDYSESEG